jgi:L-fuculose-phosphate aldolase
MIGFRRNLLRHFPSLHSSQSGPADNILLQYEQYGYELVHFGKLLHQERFVAATDGNLSVRAGKEHIVATPTGISKGMMSAADLVVVDSQGNQLYGTRKVSSEIGMHLTIYRMRPDVRAIVHAHPCTATAFASAGIALDQPLCSEAVLTLGAVPLAPYGTPGTPEVSEALKPYIPAHEAILMANHGVVTYGSTACEAYLRMEAVEHLARIVAVAKQLGQEKYLDNDNVKKLLGARERYNSRCEVALPEAKNVGPKTAVHSLSSTST